MLVVTDNSPLSALALTNWLGLLKARWQLVAIPEAVWQESRCINNAEALERLNAARAEGWLCVRPVTDRRLVEQLLTRLDPGESEAIALAIELRAEYVLIDERKGRSVASEMGLAVTGTLGLLIWAKNQDLVPSLGEAIQKLELEGELYLAADLKKIALQAVGESMP